MRYKLVLSATCGENSSGSTQVWGCEGDRHTHTHTERERERETEREREKERRKGDRRERLRYEEKGMVIFRPLSVAISLILKPFSIYKMAMKVRLHLTSIPRSCRGFPNAPSPRSSTLSVSVNSGVHRVLRFLHFAIVFMNNGDDSPSLNSSNRRCCNDCANAPHNTRVYR